MKFEEIEKLKGVSHLNVDNTYRYKVFIPDDEVYTGVYHPIFANNQYIYDFTETSEKYLERIRTTNCSVGYMFVYESSKFTKLYNLDEISLEQAQEIIDRNTILFNKIQMKMRENELINQIDAI